MLCRLLSAALALALCAAPAAAGVWNRWEYFGAFVGNGFYGLDLLSWGIYHESYGFGAGTELLQMRGETWDLARKGKQDASAHMILVPFPLDARVVLASWEGSPFVSGTRAESSNARVELHARYCPWAWFAALNEVQTNILGAQERAPVSGTVGATVWDWGVDYDAGQLWSVSAGRFDFQTREGAAFRARRDGRWYLMGRLYYGRTHGRTVGANPLNLFRDLGFRLCRMLGRCGIIEG